MALSTLLRRFSRLLAPAWLQSSLSARSKFYVREPPNSKPDWLKIGLTLGTTAFLWACLIKQHNEDVLEYKRRMGWNKLLKYQHSMLRIVITAIPLDSPIF
ncbi:NADH dehydrogenase [ubiquinone] 1 subunit C1, mitochondrial-like [Elephas maximus indicus]|uniref:NADH dehydrogenase [ubiquinone] 1 subunit C1, mitochondrial-like n=1 Tax=Elephas maximus indicus TaxID=99487 RepID=UPI00211715B6|nr:NADH dehydrogenase [ubiquinone] 1 subunit C1, mitochondrial-like [Elephas maximus indicus]